VSPVTIANSFNGENKRYDIIKRAIELARENMSIKKELKNAINEIINDNNDELYELHRT
jgi:hypothetical protein